MSRIPTHPLSLVAGATSLLLLLACGGGAKSGLIPSGTPTPSPAPPSPRIQGEPFWTSDSPERPNRARPLYLGNVPVPAIRLSDEEIRLVGKTPAEPSVVRPEMAPMVVPLRIVTGLRSFTYHLENATVLQPMDLTTATIQALVPKASGGFDTLSGVGHSDGTFSITNVPVGNYWLRFGNSFVWTSADHVEWVFDLYGRTDYVRPSTPTNLVMNAGNLNAWQTTDELLFNVPNQGSVLSAAPGTAGISNLPAAGATSLSAYTYELSTLGYSGYFGLLDATMGDQAYLNQLTTRSAAGNVYRALGRTWNLPAITMTEGATATADGAFLDLAQSSTFRLNWKRSAYAAMTSQVNPGAVVTGTEVGLWTSPLGTNFGIPWSTFQLLTYDSGPTSATTDLDLGDLPYGNPYPTAWSLLAESYFLWSVEYLAPGATTSVSVLRNAYNATTTLPTATSPIAPLVGPVLNPRINGKDLFQNQLAVGASPTISWDLPSLGTPTGYVVTIRELKNNAGRSQLLLRGTFRTASRSIVIPPGIMVSGSTYVVSISSVRFPGVNFSQYPYQTSFPYSTAPMTSAIVAP